MKMLMCVVRPNALDAIKEALSKLGIQGITVSEVKGFGRQKGHKEIYRGAEYVVDFTPKIKVEVVVKDDLTEQCVDAVCTAARTGQIGDGKIFMLSVDEVVRIRTGETGDASYLAGGTLYRATSRKTITNPDAGEGTLSLARFFCQKCLTNLFLYCINDLIQ